MTTLALPGAAIFYQTAGAGAPAIVLVHGGMCGHGDWDRITPLLTPRHTLVCLDLRGHGRSTGAASDCSIARWSDDVLALIAALQLGPAILVGHSLASRIVAEAAVQQADAVAGLVLLDGSRGHGGHAAPAPANPAPAPDLAAIIEHTIGVYADPAARAVIAARMATASPETMAACVAAMREWDLHRADAVFAQLAGALPILAIQSTYHDPAAPRHSLAATDRTTPYLDSLRTAVPQLEIEVLAQTGHFSMLEKPETIARLIADFASRAPIPHALTAGEHR